MDVRYFELHDLLCEALIALEAGDARRAAALLGKALDEVEADWLATPGELRVPLGAPGHDDGDDVDD